MSNLCWVDFDILEGLMEIQLCLEGALGWG